MAESNEDRSITLKIKSTSTTFDIEVSSKSTVSELKEAILSKLENAAKDQICLIFSGKILKDTETLLLHKITDGMAIHLVVRQAAARPASSEPATAAPPATSVPSAPIPSAAVGGSMFDSMAGMNAGNMQGMAQQMMSNPEMMRQMMDNPMMQNILGNPDIMLSMLANNPQIQNIIERNPEVGHILNDPDVMRQTMEMIRNPNMFQEMMRNHDLAIRNLQGIPGGEAALQRMYQDVQEPLLNSATGSLGGNPFASNAQEDVSSRSQRAGMENSEALPNPWGSGGGQSRAATGGHTDGTGVGAPGAGLDPIMQQMMNPSAMNFLQQQMAQNPQLVQQMIESSPIVAGNPQLAEQLRNQMPQMMNMISRPEIMQAMSNPRVMEAFRQIQQGTETIRREAPELARSFGMPVDVLGATGASSVSPNSSGSTPSSGSTASNPFGGIPMNRDMMSMMANMMGGMNIGGGGLPAPVTNPEEAYSAQLEQLANMGFNNRAQNVSALLATFGDLNAAVERLLNST